MREEVCGARDRILTITICFRRRFSKALTSALGILNSLFLLNIETQRNSLPLEGGGQIFLAKEKLRASNAFPSEQLLNSDLARYLNSLGPSQTIDVGGQVQQSTAPEKLGSSNRWNNSPPILQQLRESVRVRWQR